MNVRVNLAKVLQGTVTPESDSVANNKTQFLYSPS